MSRYPSLPFDSAAVTAERAQVQRPIGGEDACSTFLCRPFTIYVSRWIVRRTSVSANAITAAMLGLSILVPPVAWLIDSHAAFFAFCAASALFILFLDVLDGEVARLRKQTSSLGMYLDMGLWFTLAALSIVVLERANQWYLQSDFLTVVILMVTMLKLYAYVVRDAVKPTEVATTIPDRPVGSLLIRGLAERPSVYFYFFLLSVIFDQGDDLLETAVWALTLVVVGLDLWVAVRKLAGAFTTLSNAA